jgi:hypothetical protein
MANVGDVLTATYTDPTDPTDTSSDTVAIVAGALSVTEFYAAPNPFPDDVVFTYEGSGVATQFSVEIHDLNGHLVWTATQTDATEVVWDGTNDAGEALASGAYIYVVTATDGTNTFTPADTPSAKGTVFIDR